MPWLDTGTVAILAMNPTTGAPVEPMLRTLGASVFAMAYIELPNGTWTDRAGSNNCAVRGSRQSIRISS